MKRKDKDGEDQGGEVGHVNFWARLEKVRRFGLFFRARRQHVFVEDRMSRRWKNTFGDLARSSILKSDMMQSPAVADTMFRLELGALSQPCVISLTTTFHSPLPLPNPLAHPIKSKQTTLPPCTSIVPFAKQGLGTPMLDSGHTRRGTKMRRSGKDESAGGQSIGICLVSR